AVDGEHARALAGKAQHRGAAVADALAGALPGADDDGDLSLETHDGSSQAVAFRSDAIAHSILRHSRASGNAGGGPGSPLPSAGTTASVAVYTPADLCHHPDCNKNKRGGAAVTESLSGRTALVRAGANVMAADIADDRLKGLAQMMAGEGLAERLVSRSLDISDQRSCFAAVEAARARFGTLDILVNNGALGMGAIHDDHMTNLVSIEEITPEIWDRFVAVNFSGAWYLTRAAVPAMKQAGWGRIVTVTTSFYTMLRGRFHPYGPIKAGLEAMAAGHAKEFDGTGI